MRRQNKPKWGKPKLIVLGRGKPEENVLYYCKASSPHGTSSAGYWGGCSDNALNCRGCNTLGSTS